MKTTLIWCRLLLKRLLYKPIFVLTLLLIPIFVLFLQGSLRSGDAILQVALYTESSDPSALESALLQDMVEASSRTVHFYECDTLSELQADLESGRAVCGYLFPQQLEEKLRGHALKKEAVITACHHTGAMETLLLDEMVYRMIYEELAYDIVEQHIYEKRKEKPGTRLHTLYEQYQQDDTFIRFEYADGTDHQILNRQDTNYLLLPIRGICAVLILLAAMTGTVFWYEDQERKIFLWLSGSNRIIVPFLYSLIPGILAGICGLAAIALTGFARQLSQEIITMSLYLLAVSVYCTLLRELFPGRNSYLSAIPCSIVGSILFCPIFADLAMAIPIARPLRCLFPVFYYLNSIYSVQAKSILLLYSVITLIIAMGVHRLRHKM